MAVSKSTRHILEIKGRLYSGNVSEIQQEIEYDLKRYKSLMIIISDLTAIDISGVFMLYLIMRLAKEMNLEVDFIGLENKIFKSALRVSGVSQAFTSAAT